MPPLIHYQKNLYFSPNLWFCLFVFAIISNENRNVLKLFKEKLHEKAITFTYRIDKFSNLHIIAGKLSFTAKQLSENLLTIILAIIKERPAALKGIYINSINITSTMGPGIKLDVTSVSKLAKQ